MGKKQRIQGLQPDLILSSPAPRALNTAKAFAEALSYNQEQVQTADQLYEASYEQILEQIYALENTLNTVMIFGHNPAISEVVIELSREKATAGIACFEFDIDQWEAVSRENARFASQDFPAKGISG
jgi:phosphohistidine phosphatase